MAILKNLIVNGAVRCLNHIYANDLTVSGTTSFQDLNLSGSITAAGSASIGTTQANAILYLYNKIALKGTDSWLRINDTKDFSNGVYFGTSVVRMNGTLEIGSGGSKMKFTTTADNQSGITGATDGQAQFFVPIQMNGTDYYWDTAGHLVTNKATVSHGVFSDLKATDVMVTGELRSFKWNIQHIANLGGTFLVTPTLHCTPGVATFSVTAISGNVITASVSDSSAISSDSLGGATWSKDSKIKIAGKVGDIVLGTCDGVLTANMSGSNHTVSFQFTYNAQSTRPLEAKNYAASEISDLTLMLTTVGATNPIGIYMTSYDENKLSHISLYGGTSTTPVVRIGNLNNLGYLSGEEIQGWGIYTDNGYFNGVIVSNSGKIGNFYISDALYTTAKAFGTTANNVYIGSDGISLSTTFKVTNAGALTATSGSIGGWTIGTSDIHSGTHNAWNHASNGVFVGNTRIAGGNGGTWYLDQDGTGKIGRWTFASNGDLTTTVSSNTAGMGNASYAFWAGAASSSAANAPFRVSYNGDITITSATVTGAINATSGTIGSNATSGNRWQIGDKAIYNTTDSMTSTGVGTYVGVDGIRNYASATAYVDIKDGVVTALGANITGTIAATAGTIGSNSTAGNRWQIGDKAIYNTTNSMTSTGVGTYVGVDGIRNYKSATAYVNIKDGVVTALGANITGTIAATAGTIGSNSTAGNRWQIGDKAIYNTTNSMTSTGVGTYVGVDGIRNYKSSTAYVNIKDGVITALGVDLSGKITATSGAVGGFDITSTAIKTKDVAVTSNADNSIGLSSSDFTRTINGTSRAGLRFAIGDKFGITGDGVLYTSGANITNISASNISTGTLSADRIGAASISAEKLTVGDPTNYATVNENYEASMCQISGRKTVISSLSGMVIKETGTQQYLPLTTVHTANAFRQNDEIAYSIVARGDAAGDVVIMIACYDETKTFVYGHGSTITLTTGNKTFTGSIKLSDASFNTAAYYFIYINDNRGTPSQIAVKQAKFLRKASGDLIVDGAITTDKLDALAVTAAKIASGTITSAKIGAGEIKAANIDTDAVTADKILAGTITSAKIGAGEIKTANLDANAITATMISGKTISSGVFKTDVGGTVSFRYNKTTGGISDRDTINNNASLIMRPSGFQSLAASDDSILAQLRPSAMYDATSLGSPPTVGWYLTPQAYIRRLFMDSGEAASKVDVNTAITSSFTNVLKTSTPSTGVTGVSGIVSNLGIAMIRFSNLSVPANTASGTTIATLAEDYRPAVQMDILSTYNNFRFTITTGGAIQPSAAVTSATPLRGTFTYFTGVVASPTTIDYTQT